MISVIIPTYKNRSVFLANLHHNLQYIADCEIIVVNDNPQSSLASELKKIPKIKLIENKTNIGFAKSVNTGLAKACGEFILLLNDDVLLLDDSYRNALVHFKKDRSLFAVGFAQKEKSGTIVGKNRLFWKNGLIFHEKAKKMDAGYTAWAEGGSSIFYKTILEELGGFGEIYSPFYWEDIDLSYRAWKRGYHIIFDPTIVVSHQHESTIGKYFTKVQIEKIAFRNQFYFIWKNITDTKLLFEHFGLLIPNFFYYFIKAKPAFLTGFLEAGKNIYSVLNKRRSYNKKYLKTDLEILSKFYE